MLRSPYGNPQSDKISWFNSALSREWSNHQGQLLQGGKEFPDDWAAKATVIKEEGDSPGAGSSPEEEASQEERREWEDWRQEYKEIQHRTKTEEVQ